MKLSQLFNNLLAVPAEMDVNIDGLTLDSRQVKPGDLFVALQGAQRDGRDFIEAAIKQHARAVLAEGKPSLRQNNNASIILYHDNIKTILSQIAARFYHYPANALNIIGITGTNGKTSCAHLIAAALTALNQPCGVIGTLGYGLYGHIKPSLLTTPDAITLQRHFAEFVSMDAKYVAMEVSSHSLDQARVRDIPFKIGIFTNLTQDHLDYHGTMAAYGAAKRKLFEYEQLKYAVINADDTFGQALIKSMPVSKILYTYGINHQADIVVESLTLNASGITASIKTPWGTGLLTSPLIGQFNLSNLLAVLTTLCILDIPFSAAINEIAKLKPIAGRMQTIGGNEKPLIVVDYSHTPDALEKALLALRAHCTGRLFCIFGCGGDRDRGKRPMMAKIAEKNADIICVTDDNPRTEDGDLIIKDITKGFLNSNKIIVQRDRSKAISHFVREAAVGDCVLIAGKGAEMYQEINGKKIPFSDIEQVMQYLYP